MRPYSRKQERERERVGGGGGGWSGGGGEGGGFEKRRDRHTDNKEEHPSNMLVYLRDMSA